MTREEFKSFAKAIRNYYPRDNVMPTAESMELWYRELKDIDSGVAFVVLRKYVQTNKWSPTIADIRGGVAESRNDSEGWSKGWSELKAAIRKYGYMNGDEALGSLDPITRETTRRLGWKEICMADETDPTIRANFRMIYEQVANRQMERDVLSQDVLAETDRMRIEKIKSEAKRIATEMRIDDDV